LSFKVGRSDQKNAGHIKTRQRSFESKEGRFTAFLGLLPLPGLWAKKKGLKKSLGLWFKV
jgi:hypothetical protein